MQFQEEYQQAKHGKKFQIWNHQLVKIIHSFKQTLSSLGLMSDFYVQHSFQTFVKILRKQNTQLEVIIYTEEEERNFKLKQDYIRRSKEKEKQYELTNQSGESLLLESKLPQSLKQTQPQSRFPNQQQFDNNDKIQYVDEIMVNPSKSHVTISGHKSQMKDNGKFKEFELMQLHQLNNSDIIEEQQQIQQHPQQLQQKDQNLSKHNNHIQTTFATPTQQQDKQLINTKQQNNSLQTQTQLLDVNHEPIKKSTYQKQQAQQESNSQQYQYSQQQSRNSKILQESNLNNITKCQSQTLEQSFDKLQQLKQLMSQSQLNSQIVEEQDQKRFLYQMEIIKFNKQCNQITEKTNTLLQHFLNNDKYNERLNKIMVEVQNVKNQCNMKVKWNEIDIKKQEDSLIAIHQFLEQLEAKTRDHKFQQQQQYHNEQTKLNVKQLKNNNNTAQYQTNQVNTQPIQIGRKANK